MAKPTKAQQKAKAKARAQAESLRLTQKTQLAEYTRRYGFLGTFNLGPDNRISVAGKSFPDVESALAHFSKVSPRRFDEIKFGEPIYTLPSSGHLRYKKLEQLLKNMAANNTTVDFSGSVLERSTHSLGGVGATVQDLWDEYGRTAFFVPDAKKVDILRLRLKDGEHVDRATLESMIGSVLDPGSPGDKSASRLWKRLRSIMSMHESANEIPLVGHVYNPQEIYASKTGILRERVLGSKKLSKEALDAGWDGVAHMKASAVLEQAKQMKEEAKQIERAISGRKDPEAISALMEARGLRRSAANLEQTAKHGGVVMNGRALGLVDAGGEPIPGMVKADYLVVKDSDWRTHLRSVGVAEKDLDSINITTPKMAGPLSKLKIAGKQIGDFSLDAYHPNSTVFLDLQSLVSFGNDLFNPNKLAENTREVMLGHIQRFQETQELPPAYRRVLEDIVRQKGPKEGQLLTAFEDARKEAWAILDMADNGHGFTPEYSGRIVRGIEDMIVHHRFKGVRAHLGAPKEIIPGAIRGHIKSSEILSGFTDDYGATLDKTLKDFSVRYDKRYGILLNADTQAMVRHVLGGSDQDDAPVMVVRRMLDKNKKETGKFKALLFRNPNDTGEIIAADLDTSNIDDIVDLMSREDERFRSSADELLSQRRYIKLREEQTMVQSALNDALSEQGRLIGRAKREKRLRQVSDEIVALESRLQKIRNSTSTTAAMTSDKIDAGMLDLLTRMTDTITPSQVRGMVRGGRTARTSKSLRLLPGDLDGMVFYPSHPNSQLRFSLDPSDAKDTNPWLERQTRLHKQGKSGYVSKLSDLLSVKDEARITVTDSKVRAIIGDDIDSVSNAARAVKEMLANQIIQDEFGGLGGIVNTQMVMNNVMSQLPTRAKGVLPYADMEKFIDALIQSQGKNVTSAGIVQFQRAMVRGIAESIAHYGVKLDSQLMAERGEYIKADIISAIGDFDPTFFDTEKDDISKIDKIMGDTFYSEHARVHAETQQVIADAGDKVLSSKYANDPVKKIMFNLDEVKEADRIFDFYQGALEHYDYLSPSNWSPDAEIASAIGDMTPENIPARQARLVVEREFGRFIEGDNLSERGMRIFGALLQGHRQSMSPILTHGTTARMAVSAHDFFSNVVEDSPIEGRGFSLPAELFSASQKAQFDPELEEGLQAIRERPPGFVRRDAAEAGYNAASAIKNPFYERATFQKAAEMWSESKMVRRGVIGAIGAIGFSAMYHKFRDRTPEEMQGPPLLPGGSAYERTPRYDLRPDSLTPVDNGNGGVTYKVIANGQYDPLKFQNAIGAILGDVPMIGSYYNTQSDRIPHPRYNQRRSDEELFGQA